MIEFADYQCPFCGQHARDVNPSIRSQFVDNGIVREVFVNFPLPSHVYAQKASEAAECAAAQGRFWEMHDSLFGNQGALTLNDLLQRGREMGLEIEQFSECLDSGASAGVVAQHRQVGQQLNVSGTPVFFLGVVRKDGSIELKRRLNGVISVSDFGEQIRRLTPGQQVLTNAE